jgi:pyrroline-5-carboxylate reductase
MRIGLIGAGNMARAMARGWGEPVLATDAGSGRAQRLVDELGGEVVAGNGVLADRADLVVLACKPYHLEAVAAEVGDRARRVLSVLGGTPTVALRAAFPSARVVRSIPNTPVEVGKGITVVSEESDLDDDLRGLLERLGSVMVVPEALVDVASATMGVSPAYVAVVAEAMIDAAVKEGLKPDLATRLVVETIEGTAALLRARGGDTLAVRREVSSPGGVTVRGLAALERAGLRAAFLDAMDAVMGR